MITITIKDIEEISKYRPATFPDVILIPPDQWQIYMYDHGVARFKPRQKGVPRKRRKK